ncbi:MAG TPA: tetratricopeptide repeat protein [Bacteroidia bacterium]|nr:tetratricopeptide repeat protein [Bacteroidia bacterium]HNU34635.1 tetratricopeptide repeat protein [Bacteroidia bacterium]
MRLSKLFTFMLCLCTLQNLAADNLFDTANKLYMSQQYESAAKTYEDIIKLGNSSAEVFYNLGNSYFKTGDFTKAILNYERAKKLKPSDEDILFNIAIANQKTIDKIEPAPKVFYQRWWDGYVASSTAGTRSLVGVALIWLAAFVGAIYIFARSYSLKKLTFFGTFIFLFAGLFFVAVASNQNNYSQNHKEAIIIPDNVYVKSSPDDKSTNLFMLHTGTKIELKDELQGWKKIKIPNGNEGWLKDQSLEVI